MAKKYHHVFAITSLRCQIKNIQDKCGKCTRSHPCESCMRNVAALETPQWFHEISLDTKVDAQAESENLRFHGHKTKIIYSDVDPVALVDQLRNGEK